MPSAELLTAIASVGTFLVIMATAIAAVVQLYHLRSSNQIAILNDFRRSVDEPEFRDAVEFIRTLPDRMCDRAFRAEVATYPLPRALNPIAKVGRLFETLGQYVNRGMLDASRVCDLWAPFVISLWESMAEAIVVMRRARGLVWFENFEYLAVVSRRYMDRTMSTYPSNLPRIAPPDRWAAEDAVKHSSALSADS